MPVQFKKNALNRGVREDCGKRNGYEAILEELNRDLGDSQSPTLSLDQFPSPDSFNSCVAGIFTHRRLNVKAKKFLEHVAGHDGNPKSISQHDLDYAQYHLFGEQWKEKWHERFFRNSRQSSFQERIRDLGQPLLNTSSPKDLIQGSKGFLTSLRTYLEALPAKDIKRTLLPSVKFYLDSKNPKSFKDFLKSTYADFMKLPEPKKTQLFRKALAGGLPKLEILQDLLPYFTPEEATQFRREAFKKDLMGALALFEKGEIPKTGTLRQNKELKSNESEFFPKLPQNTSYKKRQAAIDKFLGKPEHYSHRSHWVINKVVSPTIKRYRWVGDTKVFVIDSGKPGPTTLIFSPHFHEKNPRKVFHWFKDVPLESGRIIWLPEANVAMRRAGKSTVPMNGLFNESLTSDRIDYVVVRRVAILMGLVDGMVGVHDGGGGLFYISDYILARDKKTKKPLAPIASPYVPKNVLKIKKLSSARRVRRFRMNNTKFREKPQLQWKIAEASRRVLEKMTDRSYYFRPEGIRGPNAPSADSATGYMNFHLRKPAMTFEGRKGAEHGQIHAQAIYSLLLAFGHKINPSFRKTLKNPNPKIEPKLYKGLPIKQPKKSPPDLDLDYDPILFCLPSNVMIL